MACGLACLATGCGRGWRSVGQGVGVLLGGQRQITHAAATIQDHPELITLLGQKARQRVLSIYTQSQHHSVGTTLYPGFGAAAG